MVPGDDVGNDSGVVLDLGLVEREVVDTEYIDVSEGKLIEVGLVWGLTEADMILSPGLVGAVWGSAVFTCTGLFVYEALGDKPASVVTWGNEVSIDEVKDAWLSLLSVAVTCDLLLSTKGEVEEIKSGDEVVMSVPLGALVMEAWLLVCWDVADLLFEAVE